MHEFPQALPVRHTLQQLPPDELANAGCGIPTGFVVGLEVGLVGFLVTIVIHEPRVGVHDGNGVLVRPSVFVGPGIFVGLGANAGLGISLGAALGCRYVCSHHHRDPGPNIGRHHHQHRHHQR